MIIRFVIKVGLNLIRWVFGLVFDGAIPIIPHNLIVTFTLMFVEMVDSAAGFFFLVIRPETFYFCIDALFFLENSMRVYNFILWVLKKIPFLSTE